MANVNGIEIKLKAFLPTGKTLEEAHAALTLVKTAKDTGDYAPVLAAAMFDEIRVEQKTRREADETSTDKDE